MTDNSIDLLIKEVKSKEWADLFIWHKEAIFEQAKAMHNKEMKEMYLKGIENYDPTFQRKDNETFGGNK